MVCFKKGKFAGARILFDILIDAIQLVSNLFVTISLLMQEGFRVISPDSEGSVKQSLPHVYQLN
jgi:hypothetical protein